MIKSKKKEKEESRQPRQIMMSNGKIATISIDTAPKGVIGKKAANEIDKIRLS